LIYVPCIVGAQFFCTIRTCPAAVDLKLFPCAWHKGADPMAL
jgi:hypothetical protein